jgi:hypothetical protein
MRKTKESSKPTNTSVVLTGVEVRAIKLLIEERLRKHDNMIKDIKGLCKIHDKVEEAELSFEVIPF